MCCFNIHSGASVIRTPVIRISARSGQFCAKYKYNPAFPIEITVVALHYYYYYYYYYLYHHHIHIVRHNKFAVRSFTLEMSDDF